MFKKNKKVYIGMSGGVDSSVSAALLKQAGYEVIGVFIRVWEPFDLAQGKPVGFCNWRQERREARRVAAHLDIPLVTLDLSDEYKKKVVDYFIAEYKAGRTPNPDVMCNKHIKFGVFYDWAMAHGADFVATGHYSRIIEKATSRAKQKVGWVSTSPSRSGKDKTSFLFGEAKDLNKDQTYFLWNLKAGQLSKILFPVGDLTKPQVRKLAQKFNLPNAQKRDSQGLCFVGQIDFKDFLKHQIKEKKGAVLDQEGGKIGEHNGITFFTLGERRGFKIFDHQPHDKPYYIVAKNVRENTLTVSQNPQIDQPDKLEIKIEQTNWINELPSLGKEYQARVRYRQPLQRCRFSTINEKKGTATIIFESQQLAASGQSVVVYDKNVCLGGGIAI